MHAGTIRGGREDRWDIQGSATPGLRAAEGFGLEVAALLGPAYRGGMLTDRPLRQAPSPRLDA